MEKKEWSIKDVDPNNEILLHGGKWSEEAKRRVREARRAGRSVADMFGDLYKKVAKKKAFQKNVTVDDDLDETLAKAGYKRVDTSSQETETVTTTANGEVYREKTVNGSKVKSKPKPKSKHESLGKKASNLIKKVKNKVFQKSVTVGDEKHLNKFLAKDGYKKRKIDRKLVKKIQDKLDKQYGQGKYKKTKIKKTKSQKLDDVRGKYMNEREKRNRAEKSVAKIKRNQTRRIVKTKEKNKKKNSFAKDPIGSNIREKFAKGDTKAANEGLIREYQSKMRKQSKKSHKESAKEHNQYNKWYLRTKELEKENSKINSRNKGSNLVENNTRKMEIMDEANKTASPEVRRINEKRTKELEAENERYYTQEKKKKKSLKQSATFDYQSVLASLRG